MTQIYGALSLLSVYFGAAFLILLFSHGLASLHFWRYCEAANLLSGPCQAGAAAVAAQGFVAFTLVAMVTMGFTRKSSRDGILLPSIDPFLASRALMFLLLAAISTVLTIHYMHHKSAAYTYSAEESVFVSMESLAWPLLLQLVFWSRQIRWKCLLAVFLAAIVAISPFRSTLFAILYFGVLVPISTKITANKFASRKTKVLGLVAALALLLFMSLAVVFQTNFRVGAETPAGDRIAAIKQALIFRGFAPFFGAAFVDHLAASQQPLPDFLASVEQKFRFGTMNLNEYVAKALFGGDGLYQETTSFFGESVANASIPPIFWEFAAPLALVLTYYLVRPVCDIGVLIAIALWRSSMGGLFDILPALVLQIAFCIILSSLQSKPHRHFGLQQREMA